jgi:hypothetical protein
MKFLDGAGGDGQRDGQGGGSYQDDRQSYGGGGGHLDDNGEIPF